MSYADDVFINMCRDVLANGTDTRGEAVRPHWEDGAQAYTIKKFTRNGGKVVLKARNPEVADIVLENDAEYSTRYRAIAEFKGVVS